MQPPHAHAASAHRASFSRPFHSSVAAAHRPVGQYPAPVPHPNPKANSPTAGMDPDQIADAGFQHQHQHEDLGGCDGGSGGDSWARALLRRGWDLSRKAAIAGVAATAAPVVAPPLLLLSLAGVALSLPFAAYLASLAATDRLMAALLPPPRTQPPYHACDLELEDDGFLGASEVLDHWCDTEDDAIIMEENESFVPPLPLSREPRFSEEPVRPSSTDVEDQMAEGEFLFRELGNESLVLDSREQEEEACTAMEDVGYITMEAPPRGSDDFGSAMPVLRDDDSMVERVLEGHLTVKESVQELSVSDNDDRTEDGRGSKTIEEIPLLQEANVSVPSVLDDTMLESKIEGDVTVEMVVKEVTINTDPFTGEATGERVDSVATALPESESPQPQDSNLVAQELDANVDEIIDAALTEDIVLDVVETNTEGMEHYGEGSVSSVVSVVTVDDVAELVSSRIRAVSGISDDMTGVKSRPDADRSNQRTCYTPRNKEFQEKEVTQDKPLKTEENKTMDDKVPTKSMSPQIIDAPKSPVPDDQSKIEDEVTVEMVLEAVTNDADDLVTQEVVAVQLNIIASASESLSVSDLVARELQSVGEAAVVDEIRGSTVMEDIKNDFSDIRTEGVEHHGDRGACNFVSGISEVTVAVDDGKDLLSSRKTPHASARDSASSVEGTPVFNNPHQTTGVDYKTVNEGFRRDAVAEDMDNYTEEQLREQLDTLRTITGYRPAPSLTLEAELLGLYIFVGVEPPVSSRDASDLNHLNTKLRFLKSIIGVE